MKQRNQIKVRLLAALVLASAKNKILDLLHASLSDLKIKVAMNPEISISTTLDVRETRCRKPGDLQ